MRINTINGLIACCEAKGVTREVSLLMLQDTGLAEGDFVVVHLGQAIERISAQEADAAWELYDEMLAQE